MRRDTTQSSRSRGPKERKPDRSTSKTSSLHSCRSAKWKTVLTWLRPKRGLRAGQWERGLVCLFPRAKYLFQLQLTLWHLTKFALQIVPNCPSPCALRGPTFLLSEGPQGALCRLAHQGWAAHSPLVSCTCGSPLL